MMTSWTKTMGVDIETFSGTDITNGAYAYADADDFEIMLVAYCIDEGEVRQFMPRRFMERPGVMGVLLGEDTQLTFLPDAKIELDGDEDEFLQLLYDPTVLKTAYNANFERTCLGRYYGTYCDPDEWQCTQVLTQVMGLPRSLADAGEALGLPEDQQKLKTGKALIQYFCVYIRPTKANGGRTRNMPRHDMEKWKLFCEYNKQDVVTEQVILKTLYKYRPNEAEQELWSLDQRICDRGIRIDVPFVKGIVEFDRQRAESLLLEAKELTGLENPNSVAQLKKYFQEQHLYSLAIDCSKAAVKEALANADLTPEIRRVLILRQELGKTSTKKYQAMLASVCRDDTVKGMLRFYGANRTGRWSGSVVQLQNLPQNHIPDLDLARQLAADQDFDMLGLMYGNVSQVLSELVRTAFIPSEGNQFVVTDFSAIEARVIAWVAGEDWRIRVFEEGGDIYCASASQMYGVPVEKHGVNSDLRQRGKVAELALGYGGGVGAMIAMDTTHAIAEADMQGIVDMWRAASPKVCKLWRRVEKAAVDAINTGRTTIIPIKASGGSIKFRHMSGNLLVKLPSGRRICYWGATALSRKSGYGSEINYWGVNQETKKWGIVSTWGGKLVENLIQSIARDCLAEKMKLVDAMGYKIVAHVHDEMIIDVPKDDAQAFDRIDACMAKPISWAHGLPLKGGTYTCNYYQKD